MECIDLGNPFTDYMLQCLFTQVEKPHRAEKYDCIPCLTLEMREAPCRSSVRRVAQKQSGLETAFWRPIGTPSFKQSPVCRRIRFPQNPAKMIGRWHC